MDQPREPHHPARLLVIDPDAEHTRTLRTELARDAMMVTPCARGDHALDALAATRPDLVILEFTLPGLPGLDVCRAIRERSEVPIVVLSARAEEIDKVLALELGANDYITKPYSRAELVARVRAALRRSSVPAASTADVVRAGPLELDCAARRATVEGRTIPLPRREFEVLELLARNAGHVVARDRLLALWGAPSSGASNSLEVHIKRLRQRIEANPSTPDHLRTVRGLGYRLDP